MSSYATSSQYHFIKDAINFVSSLWVNIAWACDLNHFNICEFNPWLQVTSIKDFDPQHNMTPHSLISSSTQCKYSLLHLSHGTSVLKPSLIPSPPLSPSKPFPCYLHLIKPYSSHITLSIHWITISSISWSLLEYLLDINIEINQASVWLT